MLPPDDRVEPLAVLIPLRGHMIVQLVAEPAPDELLLPAAPDLSEYWECNGRTALKHRHFKRVDKLRDCRVKWWRVYDDGRERTAECAYVYLERSI